MQTLKLDAQFQSHFSLGKDSSSQQLCHGIRLKAAGKMVGSSLTSLLAHSGVSLDFDLASVYQELNSKQQLDEKTAEGYYMLWSDKGAFRSFGSDYKET